MVLRGSGYTPFFKYPEERLITVEDFSDLVCSQSPPQLNDEEELWLSEDIGIADAALALEAVAVEAAAQGVVRHKTDVSRILVENGVCSGVECIDGTSITAEVTIIATGAWTPEILESSKIQLPHDFQDGFFSVTAIGVATIPLDEDEYTRLKTMPILVTDQGEVMPPNAQQKTLQITSTDTFVISHPDELKSMDYTGRIQMNRALLKKMLPEMEGRWLNYSVYQSELMTPHQHPLVDQVPKAQGLHLAVGGSYHSFKFLPVIGDIMVDYLRGTRRGVSKDGAGIDLRKRYLSTAKYCRKARFEYKIYKIKQGISQCSSSHQDAQPFSPTIQALSDLMKTITNSRNQRTIRLEFSIDDEPTYGQSTYGQSTAGSCPNGNLNARICGHRIAEGVVYCFWDFVYKDLSSLEEHFLLADQPEIIVKVGNQEAARLITSKIIETYRVQKNRFLRQERLLSFESGLTHFNCLNGHFTEEWVDDHKDNICMQAGYTDKWGDIHDDHVITLTTGGFRDMIGLDLMESRVVLTT